MPIEPTRDWKLLLSMLPSDYEQQAVEHRLLKLQWKNSKITSAADLLRLLFVHAGADIPLRQTVTVVGEAGGPEISAVVLHKKMRKAAPYLGELIARMCGDSRQATPELWDGYELLAVDASTVSGPGADGIDARMHTVIRIADVRPVQVKVTDVSEGETLRRFMWDANQLVIGDRGYANAPGIISVVDQGADVLVRVNRGALPLYEGDKAIDVLDWLRSLPGHRAFERDVTIRYGAGRAKREIAGRLIGFRLPDEQAAEARDRVLKEYGAKTTEEMLEAASYVALFTTAPCARLSAARCVEAYRLRWQIELQFKRWKSLCGFDRLPNYRDDTIRSWLSVKVLLGLILDKIGSAAAELSPPDANAESVRAQRFRRSAYRTATVEAHEHHLANGPRVDSSHRAA
jgi:hypothetical protein